VPPPKPVKKSFSTEQKVNESQEEAKGTFTQAFEKEKACASPETVDTLVDFTPDPR
jgi:hypothetical protein